MLHHNLCTLDVNSQVRFCIYHALDYVNESRILEQYGDEMGMAALEWLDIFDSVYRHSQWMSDEEWFMDMTSRVEDKWSSQRLSSPGGSRSNLPAVESDWWQDNAQVLVPPSD